MWIEFESEVHLEEKSYAEVLKGRAVLRYVAALLFTVSAKQGCQGSKISVGDVSRGAGCAGRTGVAGLVYNSRICLPWDDFA
jgi:hypothetical protein